MTVEVLGDVPLCIDLDGTLIRSDTLMESMLTLFKRNPGVVFALPGWLGMGRAHFKQQVAARAALDPASLPYNEELLVFIREQRAMGRKIVLATAADEAIAHAVASHLGLFDDVIASDGTDNLKGARKAEQLAARFGDKSFDYAGNDNADLSVWPRARSAILVNASPSVERAAHAAGPIARSFSDRAAGPGSYLTALRLSQWMKNLLVFLPMLAAHKFDNFSSLLAAGIAFFAFSLCASSVYVLNDLLDLGADRLHPRKRFRPFASGRIPILHGLAMGPLLLIAALALCIFLPRAFLAVLAIYYVATVAYSFRLKRMVLVDVLLLAGLYTIRVIAGAAATSVTPSFWLLAFSMFLFFSLAMVKRFSELMDEATAEDGRPRGRGYLVGDLNTLISVGCSSGVMSVLVLALYINNDTTGHLYRSPEAMWLICPLLLYWISRIWMAAQRRKLHDDPVIYAIRDPISRAVIVLSGILFVVASQFDVRLLDFGP